MREALLAQFTLKPLPTVGGDCVADTTCAFGAEPLSQALDMDEAHSAGAFAGGDERVFRSLFRSQADAADHLRLGISMHILLLRFFFLGFQIDFERLFFVVTSDEGLTAHVDELRRL